MNKLLLIGFSTLMALPAFAVTKLSCVGAESFSRIEVTGAANNCSQLRTSVNSALYKQRTKAKLRALVTDDVKKKVIIMGSYEIDGEAGTIYHSEGVSIESTNGPVSMFLWGPFNFESGIEIEYDSDQDLYAPFGWTALIGEMGGVDLLCYDFDLIVERSKCNLK